MTAARQPVALDGLRDQLNAYSLASAEIEKWTAIRTAAQDAIKAALGDAEVGTVDGVKAVTWATAERTTVDTKRLQADLPADVLAPYLRTITVRTFKLTAAGGTR